MLTPEEFVARWQSVHSQLVTFRTKCIQSLAIAEEDREFLLQAGLPTDAAPFLSFEAPTSGELPNLAQRYRLGNEFRRFRIIGSDGAGNPIAIDESDSGVVVILDHENKFAPALFNTSIRQLAESLLAYRKLIKDSQAEFGEDAFLDGKTSAATRRELRQTLTAIDSAAVQPGGFWHGEMQNLDANADSR